MQVVINNCFGGFNMSDEAIEECIKRGMKLTEWENGYYKDRSADFVDWSTHPDRTTLFKNRYSICNDNRKEFRTNPIVIAVVKKLGKKANGPCAKLKVIDIPFDSTDGWEIDEYDGNESIKESHRSWG